MKIIKRKPTLEFKEITQGIKCDICGRFEKYETDFHKTSKELELKENELPGIAYDITSEKVEGTVMVCIRDECDDLNFISLDICGDCSVDFVLKIIRKYKKENEYLDET